MGLAPSKSTRKSVRLVSLSDPSIDRDGSPDFEAYRKDPDLRHLRLVDDPKDPPTYFTLTPVPQDELLCIREELRGLPEDVWWKRYLDEVFRVGVVGITGAKVYGANGKPTGLTVRTEIAAGRLRRLSDDTMKAFDEGVRQEMGFAVLRLSTLGDEHRKNS